LNTAILVIVLLGAFQNYSSSPCKNNFAPDSKIGAVASAYELLADGSIHKGKNWPHRGFFVRGEIRGRNFVPRGDVQGEGKLSTTGHPGWIELYDGSSYGDETARPPRPPYVRGHKDPSGKFLPSSRKVVY
jgi:hypothetical protein